MSRLSELLEIAMLSKILRGNHTIKTNLLEEEFLEFSKYSPKALKVAIPRKYKVEGDEARHLQEVFAAEKIISEAEEIDISGAYELSPEGLLIFLSTQQIDADHENSQRAFLTPLIEEIYVNGTSMLKDFTIHEALYGRVAIQRGALDMKELGLFPDRFVAGPYCLSTVLDTPARTIQKFIQLSQMQRSAISEGKQWLLDSTKLESAVELAVGLRKKLGALSRCQTPQSQEFKAHTDTVLLDSQYHIYLKDINKNVIVYFGQEPFQPGSAPKDVILINGQHSEDALKELVSLGIYEPSPTVLNQRIAELSKGRDDAIRRDISVGSVTDLCQHLEKVADYFGRVQNKTRRKEYCLSIPAALLEFIVYPATQDAVIHGLLPRLSWNQNIRRYHDTAAFIREFTGADESAKQRMLHQVISGIVFTNQHNNDTNVWLYRTHKDFCEQAGIKFEIVS